jgi:pyridoxal phosphate enzyme (YggS family)
VRQFRGTAESVRERFAEVQSRVTAAANQAGRAPSEVAVLVATKYVDVDDMGVLRDAGIRLIGENKAQDLVAKHARYGDAFEYHFIGHLQSRKTRLVLPLVTLVHSVCTMSVVEEIEARAVQPTDVLLEVNIAAEESKSGVLARDVDAFLAAAVNCPKVRFKGLMCMPPIGGAADETRRHFAATRVLAERLSAAWSGTYTFSELSMGTSADYEIAVSEGATIVRVGSVLF